jgi:hypothetical protein
MTKKKISFKPASEVRPNFEKWIDQWVRGGDSIEGDIKEATIESDVEKEELYRLSLDIPKYLHKRIKKTCASEGVSMKVRLTELLLNTFPEK